VSANPDRAYGADRAKVNRMKTSRWALGVTSLIVVVGACNLTAAEAATTTAEPASAAVTLAPSAEPADPCFLADVTASPTRPNWDTSASTTQCGVIEVDSGWQFQTMGGGVKQTMLMSSMRYGLTPRLDLRWGVTNHMTQSGGGTAALTGTGDQWFMARYRFLEQGPRVPALAFLYGCKAPTANPAKGFGSGFADHQFTFIASRDFGKNHFDFNTVGTVVGGAQGRDGSAQFGLALTRAVTSKLAWILESYGGPQPGTPNRIGAGFTGASYTVRPTLVLDCAYAHTYTAGSPRDQVLFGFTYAMRPRFRPISRGLAIARLLGH
jgi:hypothetical protein